MQLVGQQRREPGDHRQRQQRHADRCRQRTGEGVHPRKPPGRHCPLHRLAGLPADGSRQQKRQYFNALGTWHPGLLVRREKPVEAKRPRHAVLQWLQ